MKIVFVLIILAVILLTVAIIVFFWAVKQRQFDDLEFHAYSVLNDDVYEKSSDDNSSEITESENKVVKGDKD